MNTSPRKSPPPTNVDTLSESQSALLLRFSHALDISQAPEVFCITLLTELVNIMGGNIIAFLPSDNHENSLSNLNLAIDPYGRPLSLTFAGVEIHEAKSSHVAREPFAVVFPSQDANADTPGWIRQFENHGSQSVCVLTLSIGGRYFGRICLGREGSDGFDVTELRFLQILAEYAALAIDDRLNLAASQRAHAELESERTRLRLILDLNNGVVTNLELRGLLRAISHNVRKAMDLDAVGLILPEAEGMRLRLYALDSPDSKGIVHDMVSPADGSIVGQVFHSAKSWTGRLSDLRQPESTLSVGLLQGVKIISFFPLVRRRKVLGILSLARVRENPFTKEELEFLEQIASQVAIAVENALAYRRITELTEKLTQEKLYFEDEIRSEMNFEEIVGNSVVLHNILREIETVAPTDTTVLIYGETGSGKELIARAVHNLSRRNTRAFVKLNCAAIPTGLLESELFGHEKGAFTGAVAQRVGRFELASGGTMFLDEVGEIPLELQPKLLRVLQEREFERIGNSRTLRADARLIAATNRDLENMVDENRFRSDLFYRLNVFPIRVPALRERPDDIPLLVRHFTEHFARSMNKHIGAISAESMKALTEYSWPGNVRELQNVIERAVILCRGPVLKIPLDNLKPRSATNGNGSTNHAVTLEEMEKRHILTVLEQTNWVLGGPNGAAAILGLKRPTLQFRMQKLGLSRPGRH
jgi:formate hydrogenlyase transcriptional activator